MEASDYFEDFGETHDVEEEDEEEEVAIKPTGKGKKNKQQQQLTKDKLNGELEQLALGEEDQVRTKLDQGLMLNRVASVFFLNKSVQHLCL